MPKRFGSRGTEKKSKFTHPEFQTKLTTMSCTLKSEPFLLLFLLSVYLFSIENPTCGVDDETGARAHTHRQTQHLVVFIQKIKFLLFRSCARNIFSTPSMEALTTPSKREKRKKSIQFYYLNSSHATKYDKRVTKNKKKKFSFAFVSFQFLQRKETTVGELIVGVEFILQAKCERSNCFRNEKKKIKYNICFEYV